jgi:hypothetical protein
MIGLHPLGMHQRLVCGLVLVFYVMGLGATKTSNPTGGWQAVSRLQ